MKCFVTDTEAEGVASLVGGSKDKTLDAVHIDEAARKADLARKRVKSSGYRPALTHAPARRRSVPNLEERGVNGTCRLNAYRRFGTF